jgi:S-(hydroxymethyl)glutathione dehydrogenase / alcohol dehydrogenase
VHARTAVERPQGRPASLTTRAAVFYEPGKPLEIREIELEELQQDEVLVRMVAVGICGTDLHSIQGEWNRPTPLVLGHEGAGIVERVGSEVANLRPGDRVVLSWAPSCRTCPDCRRGRPAACMWLHSAIGAGTLIGGRTGMSLEGETVFRGTATGALAERIVVHESVALPLGQGIPLEEAALLGCAALTGVGAVLFAASIEPESTVAVVGAGAVGQFVIQGAKLAGAGLIVCIEPNEARREQALALGAAAAFAPEGLRRGLAGTLPHGADYAFDAVGKSETTALTGARLDLNPAEFTRREKTLTGSMYGSADPADALPILLEHVRAGRLELKSLLGPVFGLDEVNEAIAASLDGTPGRVIVQP